MTATMSLASLLQPSLQEVTVFVATLLSCLFILQLKSANLNGRAHGDVRQAHSTHSDPTPRLGGIAIFAGVIATTAFERSYFEGRYAQFIAAMVPLLLVSIWEDVYRPTSPKVRLLATVVSCLLTILYLNVWLERLDLPLLDPWMAGSAGVVVTTLFVVGTVNGFNMVDGLNGFCAGIALSAFIALNALATAVGFAFMAQVTLALSVSVLAFLIFNFPRGRIFLGDTGSYLLGFVVVWFGLFICHRYPSVSPWALFLILAYPIGDVVITFARRLLSGSSPLAPDTRHLHHLVLFLCRHYWPSGMHREWQNPASTLLALPLAIIPMVVGVLYFDSPRILQVCAALYTALTIGLYAGLLAWTKRIKPAKSSFK